MPLYATQARPSFKSEVNVSVAIDVLDRLLVAKGLLERIRFVPSDQPARTTLASHILTAHDAAELAIAATASHLNRLPSSKQTYFMDYFGSIYKDDPDKKPVPGRDYFSKLNTIRANIKHQGLFPDVKQWHHVGERTYEYVSEWCMKYIGLPFEHIDESVLITDPGVQGYYQAALKSLSQQDYKQGLEQLGLATETLFNSNRALRNLSVGTPKAEDAIKLSAFGVHANDYLALQEFLPTIIRKPDGEYKVFWQQEKFGHPANWTKESLSFALKTFVHAAVRIQDAEWIPGPIDFFLVYEHKITALENNVEIVRWKQKDLLSPRKRIVVRTLMKNESILGQVSVKEGALEAYMTGKEWTPTLNVTLVDAGLFCEVEAEKVQVTCVPHDSDFIRKHFPNLKELERG